MKIRELTGYSGKLIKGRRCEILLLCLLPIGTELFLRTAEAAMYSLMLYFGNISPADLFTGRNAEQTVLSALFSLLRFLIMPPLWCGLAARLMMLAEGRNEPPAFSELLLSGKFITRSISAAFFVRIISALLFAPVVISAAYGINLLSDGAEGTELIAAVNLIALSIALGYCWISVRIGLTAVPFLLWRRRELSAFRAVIFSLRFMRRRRNLPFKLILTYLPLVLTIAAAPYFIPEWAASYAVGISIFFKEDETADERAYIHGGYGRSVSAEKLSPRKLRCFRRTSQAAEK